MLRQILEKCIQTFRFVVKYAIHPTLKVCVECILHYVLILIMVIIF